MCHDLHVLIMRSIALGLGLEESFFDDKVNQQCHNLRLLSYPPMKRVLLQEHGHARTGAHTGRSHLWPSFKNDLMARGTDYGSITLLFQDSVGGLEVQNPQTGEFQPAVPIVSIRVHGQVPSLIRIPSLVPSSSTLLIC